VRSDSGLADLPLTTATAAFFAVTFIAPLDILASPRRHRATARHDVAPAQATAFIESLVRKAATPLDSYELPVPHGRR